MNSRTTRRFRKSLAALPREVRNQARDAYRRFAGNPRHPSLRFKLVHAELPIYSVRVGRGYRAVGQREDDLMIWFWIGSHSEYDKLLSLL